MVTEKIYTIEKPDISQLDTAALLPIFFDSASKTREAVEKTENPEYLHWKDVKYKHWVPECFQKRKEEFWALVKFHRKVRSKGTIIRDGKKRRFTWIKLNHYEKMLHEIDIDMSRYLLNFPSITDRERQKYQIKGIIEEAIASSQLEGAHTTRRVAKQMIQERREPRNRAERMIWNNYETMKAIQEKYRDTKLSLDLLFEFHRMLMEGTSLKQEELGNFRSSDDTIVIQKGDNPQIISYVAPPIDFVKKEMGAFIAFANDESNEEEFVHPLIKAIMLHFWMGLLHPFVDGNGRLARALFYWYLLRKGYWAFAFLPISVAIKNAPAQYSEAYVLSEQDDNDLTYFIDYHIRKINAAIESFKHYIKEKILENEHIDRIFQEQKNLNRRQVELLMDFRGNPTKLVNVTLYMNTFHITKATAISDLKGLVKTGYVTSARKGRNVFYSPTEKISQVMD